MFFIFNNDFAYLDGTDEESIFSGKVGKYNWSLDKRSGELVISGSGNMVDWLSILRRFARVDFCLEQRLLRKRILIR